MASWHTCHETSVIKDIKTWKKTQHGISSSNIQELNFDNTIRPVAGQHSRQERKNGWQMQWTVSLDSRCLNILGSHVQKHGISSAEGSPVHYKQQSAVKSCQSIYQFCASILCMGHTRSRPWGSQFIVHLHGISKIQSTQPPKTAMLCQKKTWLWCI